MLLYAFCNCWIIVIINTVRPTHIFPNEQMSRYAHAREATHARNANIVTVIMTTNVLEICCVPMIIKSYWPLSVSIRARRIVHGDVWDWVESIGNFVMIPREFLPNVNRVNRVRNVKLVIVTVTKIVLEHCYVRMNMKLSSPTLASIHARLIVMKILGCGIGNSVSILRSFQNKWKCMARVGVTIFSEEG